jgi:hypothetical protein
MVQQSGTIISSMCVTMIDPNHRLVTTCEIVGISTVKLDVPSWVQKGHKGHKDTHDNYKKPKETYSDKSYKHKEKAL